MGWSPGSLVGELSNHSHPQAFCTQIPNSANERSVEGMTDRQAQWCAVPPWSGQGNQSWMNLILNNFMACHSIPGESE